MKLLEANGKGKAKKGKNESEIERIEKTGKWVLTRTGFWCYLIGVITAFITGMAIGHGIIDLTSISWAYIATILAFLGFLVGLINTIGLGTIKPEHITRFLTATVAIVVIGTGSNILWGIPLVGRYLAGITTSVFVFFAPAMVMIALKVRWDFRFLFKRAGSSGISMKR